VSLLIALLLIFWTAPETEGSKMESNIQPGGPDSTTLVEGMFPAIKADSSATYVQSTTAWPLQFEYLLLFGGVAVSMTFVRRKLNYRARRI
jgi:hypothetical protein